jgi:hypothetical protein
LIQQLLVGVQPIRFNRHTNKLYIDTDWNTLATGQYVIVEAYTVIDPETFTKCWGDRWLLRYGTALIKQQWGTNLKKFNGVQMPGGITYNGQQIYDEATIEVAGLMDELIHTWSLPPLDMYG